MVREASDWAFWEGVAEVEGGRVVEVGAWVMADGLRIEGRMEMVFGQGVLTVVQPFAEHVYVLVEEGDGFRGEYVCGADVYRVRGEYPAHRGWKMRFEVAGPKKDGWQEVRYERQMAQSFRYSKEGYGHGL